MRAGWSWSLIDCIGFLYTRFLHKDIEKKPSNLGYRDSFINLWFMVYDNSMAKNLISKILMGIL